MQEGPVGGADQLSGGDSFRPSHVNWLGMAAFSANPGLDNLICAAGGVFFAPTPPLQATTVTSKARASLRTTGSF